MNLSSFTHFNEQGRAKMVDISHKATSKRFAKAKSSIMMERSVYEKIQKQKVKKGDVLAIAQVAGIMAAKNTPNFIPMCHPLPLSGVDISFRWEENNERAILHIYAEVKTTGKTGVEMEALTAASATALTVYDMCKALDKQMTIGKTYVLEKTGGVSGDYVRQEDS